MKAKKKPYGIKQKIREEGKREERIGFAVIVAILIVIISISGFIINSMLNQQSNNESVSSTSEPKAAIVDHLSLTYPNQTFIETATNTLEQAGYTVDYYPGEEVTVEFYRNLPTHGYWLIIFRVHSGNNQYDTGPIFFWTSERYSRYSYVYEQLTDQIRGVVMLTETDRLDFAIGPEFVRQSMKGNFKNTIIIAMGCESLKDSDMAKALIEKGASIFMGWNEDVSASHTDLATTHLLQHFLIEERTIKESIQETFKEVGADPAYKSLLIYHPLEAGEYTVQNIIGTHVIVSTTVEIKRKEFSETKYQEIS